MDRRKVPVVYYLSRNGQLEHPHFLQLPLPSHGLYLRDVIQRLNQIRGRNMASMYSWSSKRSYKNGYVWQDLAEEDFIHPCHGHEYILKGSELLLLQDAADSRTFRHHQHQHFDETDTNTNTALNAGGISLNVTRSQAQSWSSSGEYMVIYKLPNAGATRSMAGGGNASADMATQTGEDRKVRRFVNDAVVGSATELGREEVSPPSSSSSSTDTVVKGLVGSCEERTVGMSGRLRVSEVLMQLIACGSKSVKDGGSMGSEGDMGARDQSPRLSVDARDQFT